MIPLLVTATFALLTTVALTPLVGRLARRFDIVDRPDGHRKLHDRIIPLGGGVAVLLGVVFAVSAMMWLPNDWRADLRQELPFLTSLFLSALVICAVGLVDDRIGLKGRQKLAGQIAAVLILVFFGPHIRNVQLFDWNVELGVLSVPFTMFWLLGAINALNLIDGIDGLATSVGIIFSLSLAGLSLLTGHATEAVVALAMAGSLSGFLWHNRPPARIFLGDAGSMLIGLAMGVIAIRSSLKGPATIALAAPTAVWAIPIFDVCMAILRRKLTGRSLYVADRAHLHHCLQNRGFSQRKTVAWIAILCACTAAGALASVYHHSEILAVASVMIVLGTLVIMRVFGHAECRLLFLRLKDVVRSFIPAQKCSQHDSRQVCARLQGNRRWEELWNALIEHAERFDLSCVQLNVNLPAIHEGYHARWSRNGRSGEPNLWQTEIPLIAQDVTVGTLQMSGHSNGGSAADRMAELMAGLKPIEADLVALLEMQPSTDIPERREAA